jgi:hypothetical protein
MDPPLRPPDHLEALKLATRSRLSGLAWGFSPTNRANKNNRGFSPGPSIRRSRNLSAAGLLATAILLTPCPPPTAHAQGCSQCREAVGETPAATRAAYRRAIIVMVAAGTTIFAAALITFRRFR